MTVDEASAATLSIVQTYLRDKYKHARVTTRINGAGDTLMIVTRLGLRTQYVGLAAKFVSLITRFGGVISESATASMFLRGDLARKMRMSQPGMTPVILNFSGDSTASALFPWLQTG
jgi:hypothetical protein